MITDNCLTGGWLQSEIIRTQPAQRSTSKENRLSLTFKKYIYKYEKRCNGVKTAVVYI